MRKEQIILFQTQGGETKIEVRLANESVWLTTDQMAELFQCNLSAFQGNISRNRKTILHVLKRYGLKKPRYIDELLIIDTYTHIYGHFQYYS